MKISIILGHPTPGSFNHAIAATAKAAIEQGGHEVWFHDLYAERFEPVMQTVELPKDSPIPADLGRHCDEIVRADGIVIVHPNYWSQPPAILKGWLDRVLRAGLAYQFVPDGQGGGKAVGLLKARRALVITTANTPQDKEIEFLGDPLEGLWKKVVFGLCGVPCERLIFSPVIVSTPEQRQQWLEEVTVRVRALFS